MADTILDRAMAALAEKFKAGYDKSKFYVDNPRDYSTLTAEQDEDGPTLRPLSFGEIVDCLAEAGLLSDETSLRADLNIRRCALNRVLGRPASADYYEAVQAVADLVNERWRAAAQAETQGLSHALLLNGYRGYADQLRAMAQRIKALEAELAQAQRGPGTEVLP